jgi:hypothetical protein
MIRHGAASSVGRPALYVVCVTAALTLVAAGLAIAGQKTEGASRGGEGKGIAQKTCFWPQVTNSKFSDQRNRAFPDTGAIYWTTTFTIPEGAKVLLKGKYAHARYQSLNSYRSSDASPTDALNDISTKPDRGSRNPYRVGARRDTPGRKRHYTVKVLSGEPPAHKRRNTLYAGVAGQDEQQLIYRVYLPDRFRKKELTGGVGLPRAILVLADGTRLRGKAACAGLDVQSDEFTFTMLPEAIYQGYRHPGGEPPTFPARNPSRWNAFYNFPFALECGYRDQCDGQPERTGGQYSNIDNNYIAATGSLAFKRGPVWVLRGKLPTYPRTGRRVKRMPGGDMRYWSICQNESAVTTIGEGCLYDSQVPVGGKRRYTIVSSRPADRPDNARRKCGVGFIPWPRNGDGAGSLDDGFLILRNMLPSPDFGRAVQDTRTPGDEKAVMGPYLPKGTYTTRAGFERRGC